MYRGEVGYCPDEGAEGHGEHAPGDPPGLGGAEPPAQVAGGDRDHQGTHVTMAYLTGIMITREPMS